MQSREIRQSDNAKKASDSSSHSNEWKKYTALKARIDHHDHFLKQLPAEPSAKPLVAGILGTMMLTTGIRGTMADQSHALQSYSDRSTGLTPAFLDQRAEIIDKSPTELHVPTQQPEAYHGPTVEQIWPHAFDKYVREIEEASKDSLQGEAQAIYDGTSSELREPLSSNEEKIAAVRALMETVKENSGDPKVQANGRKLLAEMKEQLSEQENSEARRKLEIDNRYCLDVSPSRFISNGVFPTTDPAPGYEYQATLEPFVANNCALTVTDTQLTIGQTAKCPTGTQLIKGGRNYDVPGPSPISHGQTQEQTRKEVLTSACAVFENSQIVRVYPPSIVDVSLQANAKDDEGFERFSEKFNWDVTP